MPEHNVNARLEAFSDGVFAIAMTLLVIDIKIPATEKIQTSDDLWLALLHITPSVVTFVLSFAIILITWVNHHAALKLITGSSNPFIYANGFLLLTVVILPFPTALLGESILTDHAGPAVALYNAVTALQAVGWILFFRASIKGDLTRGEKASSALRQNQRYGYFAVLLYAAAAVIAVWFPLTIAIVTILIWGFWLMVGIRTKER